MPLDLLSLHQQYALEASSAPHPATLARQIHVLVTGCTGFLGAQLLVELLTSDAHLIAHCLVRPEQDVITPRTDATPPIAVVQHRLRFLLQARQLWSAEYSQRILVYPSTLQSPLLGLDASVHKALSIVVRDIYHVAAEVNWILSYSAMRDANIIGTQQLLRFVAAASTRRCPSGNPLQLIHVSTLGVARAESAGMEHFNEPSTSAVRFYGDGYNLSKWVAEQLVHRLASRAASGIKKTTPTSAVSVSIVRPAFIGPHSLTGDSGSRDFLTRLVHTILRTRRYIHSKRTVEWTPVDTIAKQIRLLAAGFPTVDVSMRFSQDPSSPVPREGPVSFCIPPSAAPLLCLHHLSSETSTGLLTYEDMGQAVASLFPLGDPFRPLPVSVRDFLAAVRRDAACALFPLLGVVSVPGYFGEHDQSGVGEPVDPTDHPQRMHSIAMLAKRLLKQA